ncbi:preprotein translocase subunit SecG [Luteimonas dalianensis]|uniref:preprotein translocase subunit SecG n=1 Tax=Luteimonas dalianensis TaxID=1148196 RepID=UPI003BF339E4
MLLYILNILFVLVSIAMVVLILMQKGSGAAAGSGFGGGASATVFGARGSASFLTKATKWLAIAFFVITLAMAWYATRNATQVQAQQDMGLMGSIPVAPQDATPAAPAVPVPPADSAVPQAPAGEPAGSSVPAAPQPVEEEQGGN